jgi:TonB-dependent receptor
MNCLYKRHKAARHRHAPPASDLLFKCFLTLLFCFGCFGKTALAQDKLARITIRFQQIPLRQAFANIEAQSGSRIAFNTRLAELDKTVDTSFTDAGVEEILKALIKGTSLVIRKSQNYFFISSRNGAPGGLSGRIADIETTDPLANATVSIKELGKGTTSDENGYYFFETLPPGKYTLELSFVGYKKITVTGIEIRKDAANQYDGLLQAENQLQRVTVTGSRRFGRVSNTTEAQLVHEIRTSRNIVSGISNEQIQKSTDRDAGEIAKRITGVSVADNFAIIRGLNRRYNITFLNDLIAPATEQDSRAFSLDLINSSLIDKMVVYKSPVPELPGDFVGGALKISTKNTMLVRQLDVQLSASYRPNSSFSNFLTYKGGKTDWLGYDDGSRTLPSGFPDILKLSLAGIKERTQYGKMLSNIWQYVSADHDLDKRLVINYYDSWKLGKSSRVSNLTSVTYTSTVTTNTIERQFGPTIGETHEVNGKPFIRKYGQRTSSIDIQSQNSSRIGILQNFSLTLKDSSRIEFRNFFNQLGNDVVNVGVLTDAEVVDTDQKEVRLQYRQRRLYTGQLSGIHYLTERKNPLKWSLAYANTNQQEPDQRSLNYRRLWDKNIAPFEDNPASPWNLTLYEGGQYFPYNRRLFTNTIENGYTGSVDYEHKLTQKLVLKMGSYNEFKQREFSSREFEVVKGAGFFDQRIFSIGSSNINDLYHQDNYRVDGSGFELQEFAGTRYTASNQWNSGYIGLPISLFKEKLNVYAGTRYDYYRFRMAASGREGISIVYPIEVDNRDHYILPSINVSWNVSSNMIVRTAFARSINRPEFREMAPFAYFNNITQILEHGNPDLKTATFSNYDLRWEWYPESNKQNEMLNAGFFYKKGKNLIEAFTLNDQNSQSGNQLMFKNSQEADFYGVELEIRKNLEFIPSRFLRRFSVILNGSYIKTDVLAKGDSVNLSMGNSNRKDRRRPLQGQSAWLANVILNYDNVRWGSRISLSYNYSSDRISVVGNNDLGGDGIPIPGGGGDNESGFPDIMEKGRGILDFSILQRINKWLQIKASVQDLLNQPVLFYEDRNRNYKYNSETAVRDDNDRYVGDNLFLRYKPFSYYSISFNFSFY